MMEQALFRNNHMHNKIPGRVTNSSLHAGAAAPTERGVYCYCCKAGPLGVGLAVCKEQRLL